MPTTQRINPKYEQKNKQVYGFKLKKGRKSFLIYFLMLMAAGYAAFSLISTQTEIARKQSQYESLHSQLIETETTNKQLERYSKEENRAEYMEQVARDKLGYAHPSERIYYIIPAS